MKNIGIGLLSLAMLAGCASGGPVSGNSMASGAMAFSKEEYTKNPEEYSKKFAKSVGDNGAFDAYKKVIVPSYVIQFQQNYATKADSNLASKFILKEKDAMFLNISLDVEENKDVLQEIVDTSYQRFVKKLKAVGVEVVDTKTLDGNKDYQEFSKDHLVAATELVDGIYKVPATGTSRLTSYLGMGALGFTRDIETGIVAPNWYVGFGHVGGGKPESIKEEFKGVAVEFTPEIQVGGDGSWAAKYHPGSIRFVKNLSSNTKFAEGFVTAYDNREEKKAAEAGRAEGAANMKNMAMASQGGYTQGYNANDFKVSSVSSTTKVININKQKFKEAVLAELDHAEDMYLEVYKSEL